MRFAYIDSGGNEVPIPSVDALALRIELGAVGPDTQLYDAQADHWGPAHTHEIFHTLSRETGQDGFVPPPSPVPPPASAASKPAASPPSAPAPKAKPSAKAAPKQKPKPAEPAPSGAADLGLTLADPPPEPPAVEPSDASSDLALDLSAPPPPAKKSAPPRDEAPGSFDFGDVGGGLELETPSPGFDAPGASGGFGGDLPLETRMEFTGGSGVGGADDDLRLEVAGTPSFDAQPGWAAEPPPAGGDGEIMDFSSAAAAEAEERLIPPVAEPAQQRRPAKDRPSPPKFRKQRSLSGPIVLVVLTLALGVGGYAGWPILQARLERPEPPPEPVFTMPPIPPELMPRVVALAEAAIAEVVTEVDRSTAAGAAAEPDPQWLRGNYLANAGQFASVEAFWTSIGTLVQGVREADSSLGARLAQRVEAARVPADTATILLERAEAGLQVATPARQGVYDAFDRLVDAALGLHVFLVENDASIEYRPANVSTADPVLEAVPSSAAISDGMADRIEAYTDALDEALGAIDRVSRERLVTALSTRLQDVGIE